MRGLVRRAAASTVATLAALSSLILVPLPASAATVSHGGAGGAAHALRLAQAGDAKTFSTTADRVYFDEEGNATPADPAHPDGYHVTMKVSQTENLRGNQQLTVTWSGAHPTGGVTTKINYGHDGAEQEYPFVLMECRGTAKTITPETCWTQTSSERVQQANNATSYPVWRSDGYETPADRMNVVDPPGTAEDRANTDCKQQLFERWVPTVAADGTTYWGGCTGKRAPEASEEDSGGVPNNTTYGITGKDGSGSAQFDVYTAEENATLGCSTSVPCALVAIPIVGISCDGYFTQAGAGFSDLPIAAKLPKYQSACEAPDVYGAGDPSLPPNFNVATSGQLWWSASNWRNRMVVPLGFARSGNECAVVGSASPLQAYGSILFDDIADQWQPSFCEKGRQPVLHVQTTDTQARSGVASGTMTVGLSSRAPDGGFVSQTGGSAPPIVQAPVAVTGFAIAYNIDGADGQPYTRLKLDARLLAKLLTESYPGDTESLTPYPTLASNPGTIFQDPEFQALNPGVAHDIPGLGNPAAALIALSSDSDMMWALSEYVLNDPEARRWLEGVPDPWGMKVNPHYQLDLPAGDTAVDPHFTLPVESWPLLDPFTLDAKGLTNSGCLKGMPYLGQIAHPVAQLATIISDIEFAIPNDQTHCPVVDDPNNPNLFVPKTGDRQPIGSRFVLGIVPLTAVDRYGLRAASLQTTSDLGPSDSFSDAAGRTFVAPDTAGLRAGAALLAPDATSAVWDFPYDELSQPAGEKAYPGLMAVYADVPVSGLSRSDAARAADLLDFAAGSGQYPGEGVGQLPSGALPMTAANGLAAEVAYTRCAATQVRTQSGVVPSLTGPCTSSSGTSTKPGTPPGTTTSGTTGTSTGSPAGTPGASVPGATPGSGPGSGPGSTTPSGSSTASGPAVPGSTVTTADARTVADHSALGRLGLPGVTIAGLVLLVLAVGLRWATQIGQGVGWAGGLARTGIRTARTRRGGAR